MVREDETNINLGQLKEALTQGITAGDPARAAGLSTLARLTEARDAGLRQEQQRLSKLLPANDPRRASLALRLQTSAVLAERVAFEARRSDSGLESVDTKSWTLQGYLFIKDESWLKDKAVALFDNQGAIIASTETDLDGPKFVIRYTAPPPDTTNRRPQEVFAGVVGVDDRRKRALFLDTRPLTPQNGRITYVEINIGVVRPESPTPRPSPTEPDEKPRPEPVDPNRPRPGPTGSQQQGPAARGTGETPAPRGAATNRRATGRRRPPPSGGPA